MRTGLRGPHFAIAMACFVVAGCAARAQTPPADAVTLAISFPNDIRIDRMLSAGAEQSVRTTAQLTLTNSSAMPVTLQRPNACHAHVWTVTDANGNTIDGRAICSMIFVPVKLSIAAHGTFTQAEAIILRGSRYQGGGHYTLHDTFWGVEGDAPFTTQVVQ